MPTSGSIADLTAPVEPTAGGPGGFDDFFDDGDWGGRGDDGRDDSRDEDPPRPARWVTLASYLHPAEAHIARLRLESAKIPCVLLDELTAATHCLSLATGGVKLQVPAECAEDAADLLRRLRREVEGDPIVARVAGRSLATMAACVVEAAGVRCEIDSADATPDAWRLRCADADVPLAALAIARSPFAAALTEAAVHEIARVPCPACGETGSRLDWTRRVAINPGRVAAPGPWLRRWIIQRLTARRCRACGKRW